jgi:hypothetical protein
VERVRDFFLGQNSSMPSLRTKQPPIQWVMVLFPGGKEGLVNLPTDLQLVWRLRISGFRIFECYL